jgi:hypothetical protein
MENPPVIVVFIVVFPNKTTLEFGNFPAGNAEAPVWLIKSP